MYCLRVNVYCQRVSTQLQLTNISILITGHSQHSSKFVICVVLFVIHVVLLLIVMFYVLFVCKCVMLTGVNPIAVDKYININNWAQPTLFQICYLCCFVCYSCCFVVNCDVLCTVYV
jgi:hypothetical protein